MSHHIITYVYHDRIVMAIVAIVAVAAVVIVVVLHFVVVVSQVGRHLVEIDLSDNGIGDGLGSQVCLLADGRTDCRTDAERGSAYPPAIRPRFIHISSVVL